MMNITLISPNIVSQKGDVAGTGIPYIPIGLVYLATYLREKKYNINFIDTFSKDPFKIFENNGFLFQGLEPKNIEIPEDTELVILYAGQVYAHESLLQIIKVVKKKKVPIVVVENTQAVTAYSLYHVSKEFFDNDVDYVLTGEPEPRIEHLINAIKGKEKFEEVDGLIWEKAGKIIQNEKKIYQDPDKLPFPDWNLLNLESYWNIRYAHAPLSEKKYLPILTSRGCPYRCAFCVVPATNAFKWRPRSAENVVEELKINSKKYGVKEFHIEDLNPTVDKKRIVAVCKEIIKKKLKLSLKFAAGTKAETFDLETIDWMGRAGFSYISISPESGSMNVLKLMDKFFNHELSIKQVKRMHELGITSQACFVLGFPGETEKDLIITQSYIKKLVKAGLDEIALFIMTPVPGSKVYEKVALKNRKISELTFSPSWRKEYGYLSKWRTKLVMTFLITKLIYHPVKLGKHLISLVSGNFNTKIEMTLYRLLQTHFLFRRKK